jgi:hypothetical protein
LQYIGGRHSGIHSWTKDLSTFVAERKDEL